MVVRDAKVSDMARGSYSHAFLMAGKTIRTIVKSFRNSRTCLIFILSKKDTPTVVSTRTGMSKTLFAQ